MGRGLRGWNGVGKKISAAKWGRQGLGHTADSCTCAQLLMRLMMIVVELVEIEIILQEFYV